MIDTSLNRKYRAKEAPNMDFSPIPDGEYTLRVKEVTPWTPVTKTIKVIQRDENGTALTNEKGDKVTELVENCTFYNCNVKLEVVGGAYDKRLIFHNLSTHPNMPFNIPAFLYGLDMNEVSASEIQKETVGKVCLGVVYTDSYEKTIQNKETALEEIETKYINRVKSFKKLPVKDLPNNDVDVDLGI